MIALYFTYRFVSFCLKITFSLEKNLRGSSLRVGVLSDEKMKIDL